MSIVPKDDPWLTMKHEDIRTGPALGQQEPVYRPVNDPVEMERRINALDAKVAKLTQTVEMMSHVIAHIQQAQVRTIERMLSVMEEPQ